MAVFSSFNRSFTRAGTGSQVLNSQIKSRRCWIMQGTLTRELLGSLWREEISFGKGSLILKGIQHVQSWQGEQEIISWSLKFWIKIQKLQVKAVLTVVLICLLAKWSELTTPDCINSVGNRQIAHFSLWILIHPWNHKYPRSGVNSQGRKQWEWGCPHHFDVHGSVKEQLPIEHGWGSLRILGQVLRALTGSTNFKKPFFECSVDLDFKTF